MKLLDKWSPFRLQKRMAELEQNVANLQQKLAEEIKTHDELKKQKCFKPIKSVKHISDNQIYYVVSQGGFYEIRGQKLTYNSSQVSKMAYRCGFVVASRDEAEKLFKAMKALVE